MDINKLATALQGFGAGVQGRGAEFLAARQGQQQQLDNSRKQAWAVDNRNILGHLQSGNTDRAVTLLNNRLMDINEMGGNPSTSQFLKTAIEEGDVGGALQLVEALDREFSNAGFIEPMAQPEPIKLGANERLIDPNTNEEIVGAVEQEQSTELPESLVAGLDPAAQQAARDAYRAADGGAAGLNAAQDVIANTEEGKRRQNLPDIIERMYPDASPEDLPVMIEAAKNAGSVEDGIKAAGEIRDERETARKAQGVQFRAIDLLSRILENDQTDQVVGSIQGGFMRNVNPLSHFDQGEANAIADIEEVGNILTGENLDMMTGVLSESDIQIIASIAGGGLNRKRGDAEFRKDVKRILGRLMGGQNLTPQAIQSLSDTELQMYEKALKLLDD